MCCVSAVGHCDTRGKEILEQLDGSWPHKNYGTGTEVKILLYLLQREKLTEG